MRPIEIKDLIVGLTAIALLAVATGQLDKLHRFAKKEAANALRKGPQHSPFFPKDYRK